MDKCKKGFTLVELLIVISIIGILAGMTIVVLKPSYFYGKGRDAQRKTDLEAVRGALEQFYLDNGRQYPAGGYSDLNLNILDEYLDHFPNDPQSSEGKTYYYLTVGSGERKCYELAAVLETDGSRYEVCGGSLVCQRNNSLCQ